LHSAPCIVVGVNGGAEAQPPTNNITEDIKTVLSITVLQYSAGLNGVFIRYGGKYQSIRWKDTLKFSIIENQKFPQIYFRVLKILFGVKVELLLNS
jgi:hypothetical protein